MPRCSKRRRTVKATYLNYRNRMKNIMRYSSPLFLTFLLILSGCARHQTKPTYVIDESKNTEFFDVSPGERNVSYLYAPGLMGSELVMGRYCPEFVASMSGEKIRWKVGGNVIGKPHSAVLFPEIDLRKPEGFTLNPVRAFINKIRRDMFPLAQRFMYEQYGITVVDNPASPYTVVNYNFNFGRANIGQRRDIRALQRTYLKHIQNYPNTDVILYGDSRGAATIFNFIALYNPSQVKAAVMEGCFDAIPHLMKHCIFSDKDAAAEKRLHGTLSFVMRGYKDSALSPRQYAEKINDDIPLLFVTSLKDWVVPSQCTFYLYNRLRERGHQKVHILVLQHSSHPGYMLDNAEDRDLYESVVHAFYKQYGLPHNAARANDGYAAFMRTQPTPEELTALHKIPHCTICW